MEIDQFGLSMLNLSLVLLWSSHNNDNILLLLLTSDLRLFYLLVLLSLLIVIFFLSCFKCSLAVAIVVPRIKLKLKFSIPGHDIKFPRRIRACKVLTGCEKAQVCKYCANSSFVLSFCTIQLIAQVYFDLFTIGCNF